MNARWSSINIADLATFLRQRGSLFVAATLCLSFAACAGVNAPKIPDSPQVDNNTPDKPTIGKGVAKKHQADNPEIAPTVDSQSANEHLVVYVEKKLADGKTQRMEADGWYYDYDAAKNKGYNG